jgi:RHS repeat-associated protein
LTGIAYSRNGTPLGDLTYEYDAAGNRISIGGSFARTGLPQALASAVYDAANRLTEWGNTALTYDDNGNLTSDGVNAFVWDARDRMASTTGATFQYDVFGRRIGKTVGGVATQFLYDGLNVTQELGDNPATLLTGLGLDEVFTRTDANGARFPLPDGLNSTLALTDANGAVQTSYTYGPFGATTVTGTSNANPFQYTNRENDGTGLYYYRARYYSPTFQRFASEDPIGFGGGINQYAYVGNSPLNWVDPSGNAPNDRWYGYDNQNFKSWYHRNWKPPGSGDAGKGLLSEECNHRSTGSGNRAQQ